VPPVNQQSDRIHLLKKEGFTERVEIAPFSRLPKHPRLPWMRQKFFGGVFGEGQRHEKGSAIVNRSF